MVLILGIDVRAGCGIDRLGRVRDVHMLRLGFDAGEDLFRSGWSSSSTITELAAMLVLRTNRRFYRSRPGRALLWSIAAITIAIRYSRLAWPLGLTSIPAKLLITLAGLTVLSTAANETAKLRLPPLD